MAIERVIRKTQKVSSEAIQAKGNSVNVRGPNIDASPLRLPRPSNTHPD